MTHSYPDSGGMALHLYLSQAAVRSGQLDRSCRVRDPQTGAYELFHPKSMRSDLREMLERALETVRKQPDKWPARTTFRGQPRGYVVRADATRAPAV